MANMIMINVQDLQNNLCIGNLMAKMLPFKKSFDIICLEIKNNNK